ncbi:hypothetical protein PALB_22460 [Pseudoalteromonas luteoviolacea B = ATCC 29581]|nr:hypothetical protein PALB_22460 [Pseudoalteromonas luteoviolacea B = ATCC 29581]
MCDFSEHLQVFRQGIDWVYTQIIKMAPTSGAIGKHYLATGESGFK